MADTYSQIFYHIVFAVKGRQASIVPEIKNDLYKYIAGIIENSGQKLFIINGMPDHVHILLNCKPNMNLSDLVREIKEHSTRFIINKNILRGKFYWQAGFGAFTVSKRDVSMILNYISNQEQHHKKISFKEEYISALRENDVEYKEEYLFQFAG